MKVFLDNSATTRPFDEVTEYMNNIQREHWGNPSSAHSSGMDAERIVKDSAKAVTHILNTESDNIIFTSGGTEANNMAIMQPFYNTSKIKEKHIIISAIEHPAVIGPCEYYEGQGAQLTKVPVDQFGQIDIDSLRSSITADTAMISVMFANNEVGTIQPIKEISRIKENLTKDCNNNILFHADAVQAFGKIPIDLEDSSLKGLDMMSISAHKIHGPKGSGALYVRNPEKIKPFVIGGGQQKNRRSGTENVAGIGGLGLASKIQCADLSEKMKSVGELRNKLMSWLKDSIDNIRINSPEEISVSGEPGKCIPNVLSVSFPGTKGEVILHSLEQAGIFVSTESACSSKKAGASPVLSAMGLTAEEAEGTIRFSLSRFNTEKEIEYTVIETKKAVQKMRKLTRFKR